MSDNIITLNQEVIHTELKDLVRNSVEEALNSLLDAEAVYSGLWYITCPASGNQIFIILILRSLVCLN